jgi:hypothetical protein
MLTRRKTFHKTESEMTSICEGGEGGAGRGEVGGGGGEGGGVLGGLVAQGRGR